MQTPASRGQETKVTHQTVPIPGDAKRSGSSPVDVKSTLPVVTDAKKGPLQVGYEQIAMMMEARFSAYANSSLLWSDRDKHEVSPILATDPPFVGLFKHTLLIMKGAEKALNLMGKIEDMPRIGTNILDYVRLIRAIYTDLVKHIRSLIVLARELNIPTKSLELLTNVSSLFPELGFDSMSHQQIAQSISEKLTNNSPALAEGMNKLIKGFFDSRLPQPKVPTMPLEPFVAAEEKAATSVARIKREWLGVVARPVRNLKEELAFLTNMVAQHFEDRNVVGRVAQGDSKSEVDPEMRKRIKFLKDSSTALLAKNTKIDKKGYMKYSDKDTSLSQSLKAISNVLWAINAIGNGDYISGARMAKKHFDKIDWSGLSVDMKEILESLLDAALAQAKDLIEPALVNLAKRSHEIELSNGIKYGELTKFARPYLDDVSRIFIERGISISNPLGAVVDEDESYHEELAVLQFDSKAEDLESRQVSELSKLLDEYVLASRIVSGDEKAFVRKLVGAGTEYKLSGQASWMSFIGGIGEIRDQFFADMILAPGRRIAEATVGATLDLLGAFKQYFSKLPRRELLTALMKDNCEIKEEDIRPLRDRIVSEMEPADREAYLLALRGDASLADLPPKNRERFGSLIEALAIEVQKDKASAEEQSQRNMLSRLGHGTFGVAKTLATGVAKTVGNVAGKIMVSDEKLDVSPWAVKADQVRDVIAKKKTVLADRRLKFNALTEALATRREIRLEYAQHQLQTHGIADLIRATRAATAESQAKINIGEKRQLAIIAADLRGDSRHLAENYHVRNAHQKAVELSSGEPLTQFITDLYTDPKMKTIGHFLAVEVSLAGYLEVDAFSRDEKALGILQPFTVTDLSRALELPEVITLISQALSEEKQDENAQARFNLFNKLLSEVTGGVSAPSVFAFANKAEWLKFYVEQYNQLANAEIPNKKMLLNKMGLMLGYIVRQPGNDEVARLVFSPEHSAARVILFSECVEKTNKQNNALYYEGLVIAKANLSAPSFNVLIVNNQELIVEMYRAVHQSQKSVEDILGLCSKTPWSLCELIKEFHDTHTSQDGIAEDRLRKLFSKVVLSDEGKHFRHTMLDRSEGGDKYLDFLSPSMVDDYWVAVREDFKTIHDFNHELNISNKFAPIYAELIANPEAKAELKKLEEQLYEKLARVANKASKAEYNEGAVRYVKQEMDAVVIEADLLVERYKGMVSQKKLTLNLLREVIDALSEPFKEYINDRNGIGEALSADRQRRVQVAQAVVKEFEAVKDEIKRSEVMDVDHYVLRIKEVQTRATSRFERLTGDVMEHKRGSGANIQPQGRLGDAFAKMNNRSNQLNGFGDPNRRSQQRQAARAETDELKFKIGALAFLVCAFVAAVKVFLTYQAPPNASPECLERMKIR